MLRFPPDEAYTQLKYSPFGFRIPGVVDESLILSTLKEISIKVSQKRLGQGSDFALTILLSPRRKRRRKKVKQ